MRAQAPTPIRRELDKLSAVAKIDAAIDAAKATRAAQWAANKTHGHKPLPPYGRQWIQAGRRYGPVIFCGPRAWDMAARRAHSGFALVAPVDRDPLDLDWSLVEGRETVLIEAGGFDTELVERTALALLLGGSPHVRTLRRVYPEQPVPMCGSYAGDGYVPK